MNFSERPPLLVAVETIWERGFNSEKERMTLHQRIAVHSAEQQMVELLSQGHRTK